MTADARRTVIVVGAGIGGLTTAIALRRAGIGVEVYDAADTTPNYGITLTANGVAALRTLGIELAPSDREAPWESYRFMTFRGRTLKRMPLGEIHARLGVTSMLTSKADLRQLLLKEAEGIPLTEDARATGYRIDDRSARVTVEFADGRRAEGDALIGADGINSVVRRQLAGPEPTRYAGHICWLSIVAFEHPHFATGASNHYLGAGQRFGLHGIGGGRAFWWATKDMPRAAARDWSGGKDQIRRAYEGWADEVQQVIRVTPEESIAVVPMEDRAVRDRWGIGPVTLLGDAVHAMLSNTGQGAAMTIEDAVVLARSLAAAADPAQGLREYENRRRDRTRRAVERARQMSDLEQASRPMLRFARAVTTHLVPTRVQANAMRSMMTLPASIG
ncbi:FAD-dependent monooxygenase [Nocardia sp. CDC159]|uniref:FAD-dependent monooxygenase n=1 Tax=Nocardia pulmonis TaxID=2951408 RepID=A0A9X2E6U9_9NOCA|nr:MULTISPECIES: NAD(P)/FAD-dependent oxidoreductase [Nocardia]MCM6772588.1 FAD-dependent monooxygenase [Nocardia pulmonis]MCM6784754.1 FAD-dependent monooxygenase [Nocardia sp. CDC159]